MNADELVKAAAGAGTAPGSRFRTLTTAELMQLPPPNFVLEPFLVRNALNLLFGASGSYKSFIALDWACCIASGQSWHGTSVEQGPVLYIAGEGSGGIPKRLDAWAKARRVPLPDEMTWIPEPIPLRDGSAVEWICEYLAGWESPPALVVVETFARALAGGNENSSDDVGTLIAGLDRIRVETNAAILITHHTGWEHVGRERGWSGFPAALDTSILVDRRAPLTVKLTRRKAKDAEEFEAVHLSLHPCNGSLVVVRAVDPVDERDKDIRDRVLAYIAANPGAGQNDIEKHAGARREDVRQVLSQLIADANVYVELVGRKHCHYRNAPASRGASGRTDVGDLAAGAPRAPRPMGGAPENAVPYAPQAAGRTAWGDPDDHDLQDGGW